MSTAVAFKQISHPYITREAGVCGGSPIIGGTRMRVIDIAIEYDRLGHSPDHIVDLHPHLSLEQVHDALSYYYENRDALDQEMVLRKNRIEATSKKYPRKIKWLQSEN
jgi:uncharacterized protein (DUF433 family)